MPSIEPTVPSPGVVPPAASTAPASLVAPRLASNGDELVLTGLTQEEAGFVQTGFLPSNFAGLRRVQKTQGKEAAMALHRAGKQGPFNRTYGDPDVMLAAARRWEKMPEMAQLVRSMRAGDILAITYNDPNDLVTKFTKGPFTHTLLCVGDGPPPDLIEAVGVTGTPNDPAGNRVLRSMASNVWPEGMSARLIRPTEGMPAHEADKAIRRAIAYATRALGKPYDFAFTDTNGSGMNDAYYCSELTYKAYADPRGADLPIPLRKAAERDRATAALDHVLEALGPDDKGALTFEIGQLLTRRPVQDAAIVDLIVEKVAPQTALLRPVADSPERRAALRRTIETLVAGRGFSHTLKALDSFGQNERDGQFQGLGGWVRRAGGLWGLTWSAARDVRDLTAGIGVLRSLGVAWKLAHAFVPHAETLTRFAFGPEDPRSRRIHASLDQLDGLARDARRVPALGSLWPLPSRAPVQVSSDFVSPTDLAWADLPHWDFAVNPARPLDEVAWKNLHPLHGAQASNK